MRSVILTGFMATGKTEVGRRARPAARPSLRRHRRADRADVRPDRRGDFRSIGEPEFRRRESQTLASLGALDDAIVSTGGGTAVDARNRASMRAAGWIVCLTADAETILARVGGGEDRPLLAATSDRAAKVRELLAERAEAYADADWTIDTSGKTVEVVSREIADWLRTQRAANRTSRR